MAGLLLRGMIGGLIVSVFAILADVLKPKRFAGLFGAAPSVALATLMLTLRTHGCDYAAIEARSMIGGAVALAAYAYAACLVLWRCPRHVPVIVGVLLPIWGAAAALAWAAFLR